MIPITINKEIYDACPHFISVQLQCKVSNTKYNPLLWQEIEMFIKHFQNNNIINDIKNNIAIQATRNTYKILGKDPNRYRPSGEALRRRILRGFKLYKINTLVDAINLISLKTGYSIGGFDADLIDGPLELGVGIKDEKFEAIGRGFLNIEGLPVYRDNVGGIGTPTSDEERTKIGLDTKTLLLLLNAYSGEEKLEDAITYSKDILSKYAKAENLKITKHNSSFVL